MNNFQLIKDILAEDIDVEFGIESLFYASRLYKKESISIDILLQCGGYAKLINQLIKLCFKKQFALTSNNYIYVYNLSFLLYGFQDDIDFLEYYMQNHPSKNDNLIEKSTQYFCLCLFQKNQDIQLLHKEKIYKFLLNAHKLALKNMYTTNIQEVQRLVSIMSEYHMDQTQEAKGNDDYYSFDSVNYWLFPYEILTWLKLRELKGLKNPKTFTHPLMNTPIAKMFLNIKEPLPYPKELPYAKELLERLQEQCPDVEIPRWLKGVHEQDDKIIKDDFFIEE